MAAAGGAGGGFPAPLNLTTRALQLTQIISSGIYDIYICDLSAYPDVIAYINALIAFNNSTCYGEMFNLGFKHIPNPVTYHCAGKGFNSESEKAIKSFLTLFNTSASATRKATAGGVGRAAGAGIIFYYNDAAGELHILLGNESGFIIEKDNTTTPPTPYYNIPGVIDITNPLVPPAPKRIDAPTFDRLFQSLGGTLSYNDADKVFRLMAQYLSNELRVPVHSTQLKLVNKPTIPVCAWTTKFRINPSTIGIIKGGVEKGENPLIALQREIEEELGLRLNLDHSTLTITMLEAPSTMYAINSVSPEIEIRSFSQYMSPRIGGTFIPVACLGTAPASIAAAGAAAGVAPSAIAATAGAAGATPAAPVAATAVGGAGAKAVDISRVISEITRKIISEVEIPSCKIKFYQDPFDSIIDNLRKYSSEFDIAKFNRNYNQIMGKYASCFTEEFKTLLENLRNEINKIKGWRHGGRRTQNKRHKKSKKYTTRIRK